MTSLYLRMTSWIACSPASWSRTSQSRIWWRQESMPTWPRASPSSSTLRSTSGVNLLLGSASLSAHSARIGGCPSRTDFAKDDRRPKHAQRSQAQRTRRAHRREVERRSGRARLVALGRSTDRLVSRRVVTDRLGANDRWLQVGRVPYVRGTRQMGGER